MVDGRVPDGSGYCPRSCLTLAAPIRLRNTIDSRRTLVQFPPLDDLDDRLFVTDVTDLRFEAGRPEDATHFGFRARQTEIDSSVAEVVGERCQRLRSGDVDGRRGDEVEHDETNRPGLRVEPVEEIATD